MQEDGNAEGYIMGDGSLELQRISALHEITVQHMGKLFCAPVDLHREKGLRILDSGTADGKWLRELHQTYGSSHTYIGSDIVEAFFPPITDTTPISLSIQDITKAWPANWLHSFNIVHQALTLGGVGLSSPKDAVMRLTELAAPQSGWVELWEMDLTESRDNNPDVERLWRLIREVFVALGTGGDFQTHLKAWLEEAGLVDVAECTFVVPVGAKSPREDMARKSRWSLVQTAKSLLMAAQQLPTSFQPDELDEMLPRLEKALQDEGGFYKLYAVWGRKP